ncbi:uncharacterized protein LOC113237409 isoform X2 [Hyposmocoma kahamanoa]|uniref:uncharacterized protein LOC113237409 isoform X2 n=1 Tax=Hyposmocoma kahamanoa TaxID=1477025 RepID=UPI000E6D91CA|nr:uncharacterized protein LOC113237409 isoform X2 [Hyposmocoma kahamanoa]
MSAPLAALLALAACSAHADAFREDDDVALKVYLQNGRSIKALGSPDLPPPGCLYEGRWYVEGATVRAREPCLRCVCGGGALTCARRACALLPDPPPARCHVLHRRGSCCPELHCPDGVRAMEYGASARLEHNDFSDGDASPSYGHACVEGGVVFAAGSALASRVACETCFCLGGSRRCVRPRCMPAPHGCRARPAPGACCPQRYYCDEPSPPLPSHNHHRHDCEVEGTRIAEGERVLSAEANCTQCFCLRGSVRCQRLACGPPLLGCTPLLRNGECCPHQYHCAQDSLSAHLPIVSENSLTLTIMTTKLEESGTEAKLEIDKTTTVQPEGSVRVIVNGTVNCTAELTSSPTNRTAMNYTEKNQLEAQPRVPFLSGIMSAVTSDPNDIITDRNVHGGFDENDTFTINVTSLLSHTASPASPASPATQSTVGKVLPPVLDDGVNISAKTKDDYDYDYNVPTLPPSLPNLKIIPFVAADAVAVVDDDTSKDTYPSVEREDKFPIYYPTVESKVTPIATRREDAYLPTQYPVYVDKDDSGKYSSLADEINLTKVGHPGFNNLASILHEYTVSTSLGTHGPERSKVTKSPVKTTSFKLPAINLFSPPAETEGGFIPKGPGIIDEYYAVYPSTPPGPSVAHLTTSMQIDVAKAGECVSSDGRHVPEGDSISVACSVCTCRWSELHCVPRPCLIPPGCHRRPTTSSAGDLCCGELVCEKDHKPTVAPMPTRDNEVTFNSSKMPFEIKSEIVLFDPPPDRSVPEKSSTEPTAVTETLPDEYSVAKEVGTTTEVTIKTTTDVTNIPNKINNVTKKIQDATTINAKPAPEKVSSTRQTTTTVDSTIITPLHKELNETNSQSEEYEDDEEDDSFSFGSVLKLLLSDSYDATTATPKRKLTSPAAKSTATTITTTVTPTPPMRKQPSKPTVASFIPMSHHPYIPPKKVLPQNTVNRIDHLVLGEATAIKKSTPRPVTTSFRPMTTHFTRTTTRRLATTMRTEVTKKDEMSVQYTSVAHEGSRPQVPSGGALPGGSLLKLAGCNIYGRMYRVGRIIAELSTPCQECRCTELGVQCRALSC